MGQRLNIEIHKDGEVIANAYYHWSAYTRSAIELVKQIIDGIGAVQEENESLKAVSLLELTGARLTESEISYAKNIDSNKEYVAATSRNDGLIAISEEGISETRKWQESSVEIDLQREVIDFDVLYMYSKEEYEEYNEEDEFDELLKTDFDLLSPVPFDRFKNFASIVDAFIEGGNYEVKIDNGDEESVIGFIE